MPKQKLNEMLQEKLTQHIAMFTTNTAILTKMLATDWENLPVDSIVYVKTSLSDFLRDAEPRHFKELGVNGSITVFQCGTSSKTSQHTQGASVTYALTEADYLKLR